MTRWTFIRRSARHYFRSHLGLLLGAAIGTAALTGALVVGDSVRASLTAQALERLGNTWYALHTGDRWFSHAFADRYLAAGSNATARSYGLLLPGTAGRPDGSARVNRVTVAGVDPASWSKFAGWNGGLDGSWSTGDSNAIPRVLLNETLAAALGARENDEIILRVPKPSAVGMDAVISPRDDTAVGLRVRVGPIVPAEKLGNFALTAGPGRQANAFLPIRYLAEKAGIAGRANLLVSGPVTDPAAAGTPLPSGASLERLRTQVSNTWLPEDVGFAVKVIAPPPDLNSNRPAPMVEVSSSRIFLAPPLMEAALQPRHQAIAPRPGLAEDPATDAAFCRSATNGIPVFTYLATLLRSADRAVPYSMVTAAGPPYVSPQLGSNEMVINEWLARELLARPGDEIDLSYFIPDSANRLVERTNRFRVRSVVPMQGLFADRTLMPEFPGLAKAERTRDWDAGFKLTHRIRDEDEAYWKDWRGTPKAFIPLATGAELWANRFGSLTAIRFPVPTNSTPDAWRAAVYRHLVANLDPAVLGLRFEPVRAQALAGAAQGQDFGGLFIGFSLFLVVAALLLMAMLFRFSLEQRRAEAGTLMALGFTEDWVRRCRLIEAAVLALAGGLAGAAAGLAYAQAMIWGLTHVWTDAVAGSSLRFHANPTTVAAGGLAGFVVALGTTWLALRLDARQSAVALMAGMLNLPRHRPVRWARGIGAGCLMVAASLVVGSIVQGKLADPGVFFEAGLLLLLGGLALVRSTLGSPAGGPLTQSLGELAWRSCRRRPGRSLATVALLAGATFVIVSMSVFRLDAQREARNPRSGTGGFRWVGSTALPVAQDLDTAAGREFFGLDTPELGGVKVASFRVKEGDEASCLNLGRAQRPRLLGVNPAQMAGRFTFVKTAAGLDRARGWDLLRAALPAGEIAAIGDANSIQWALGKQVGDTLEYVDDQGRPVRVRLVGAVANSILQGSLVVDEQALAARFPSENGYRWFLVDAPAGAKPELAATLGRALQDAGLELEPAAARLNRFNAVQNTYLGTFQVLGGLGLLLGSAGLGVVVLRNVLERRGELAVLAALGFRRRQVRRLLLLEHGALLALGLGLGTAAAALAVIPSWLTSSLPFPWVSVGLTLAAVWINGLLWTLLATRWALRGRLIDGLRSE